jgi:hypothetical protein
MLATNPVDPDYTFRFQTLQTIGDHSHFPRSEERGVGGAAGLLGAAALLVIGYVVGGLASSATVASAGDLPLPVDIGGGAAKAAPFRTPTGAVVGEFRLGPGNDPAPGVVRLTMPAPAVGEFRLGPGNLQPAGVVRATMPAPAVGEFRLGPGNLQPAGIVRAAGAPVVGEFRLAPGNQQPAGIVGR